MQLMNVICAYTYQVLDNPDHAEGCEEQPPESTSFQGKDVEFHTARLMMRMIRVPVAIRVAMPTKGKARAAKSEINKATSKPSGRVIIVYHLVMEAMTKPRPVRPPKKMKKLHPNSLGLPAEDWGYRSGRS